MNLPSQWRPVVGYEGLYLVSDHGQIVSTPRRGTRGKELAHSQDLAGYLKVNLSKCSKRETKLVHTLIMEAFVGPRPDGQETRHLNGNMQDCRLENLVYGTHSENMQDVVTHGTHHNTLKTHCANGHELSGYNVFQPAGPKKERRCRKCHSDAELARYYANRAKHHLV